MTGQDKPQGIAIVTGAARGIGAACAKALVEDGWTDLLICDLNGDLLEETAQKLHNSGARITTLAGDVTAPDFMERLIAACDGKPVAAAVHAAGVAPKMVDTARMLEINWESALSLRASSPNTCGCRRVILSQIAATTSPKSNAPCSRAICAWKTTCNSRSPSSSFRSARSPRSIASATS